MKFGKYLLAAALMISGVAAQAQEEPEFNHHWFLQFQGGANGALDQADFLKTIKPTAQFAVGYQFTPVWALRLAFNGAWQQMGISNDYKYTYNYIAPALDVKINLMNVCGYKSSRIFGLNLIVGAGVNYGFKNDRADDVITAAGLEPFHYWNGKIGDFKKQQFNPLGRVGLDLDFKVAKRLSINLEGILNAAILDKYNSRKIKDGKKNFPFGPDYYITAMLGLKVALGQVEKEVEPEPVVAPVVVEEPAPEPEPAPVVVKETPKPQPIVKAAPEMKTEIFYAIRGTKVTAEEQYKVDNLITFLQTNPETKVTVTGYADAGTGNAKVNQKYSEQRAENVAKALTAAGIDASRITVDAKGDTVQPFSENDKNRVTIAIAK
jgi:outer membrane protein OmpA-like peptidoglycan-associated protein